MTTTYRSFLGIIAFIVLAIGLCTGLMALYVMPHYFLRIPYDVPSYITNLRVYYQEIYSLDYWQSSLALMLTLLTPCFLSALITSWLSYRLQQEPGVPQMSVGLIVIAVLFVLSSGSLWFLLS